MNRIGLPNLLLGLAVVCLVLSLLVGSGTLALLVSVAGLVLLLAAIVVRARDRQRE